MSLLTDIFAAYFDARRYKRNSNSQLSFERDMESNLMELYRQLISREYKVDSSSCFMVYKPVKREVFAATFRDRVVHHLIYNYVSPMLESTFIDDCYSCRVGRGTLFGIKRLDYHIKSCTENGTKDAWILKLDIQGYFMNIDRAILYDKVWNVLVKNRRRKAPDGQKWGDKLDYSLLQFLLREIIFNDPVKNCIVKGSPSDWDDLPHNKSLFYSKKGSGLPIGNLTSQLFSNIYLSDFDNYCKRTLKIKHYGRYVDDFYVVHNSQEYLRDLIGVFDKYLTENLQLTIHPKKIYLQHAAHGVNFLGSKVNGRSILVGERVRKGVMSMIYDTNALAEKSSDKGMENIIPTFVEQMNSYLGIMSHSHSYGLRKRLISKVSARIMTHIMVSTDLSKMVPLLRPRVELFDPLRGVL